MVVRRPNGAKIKMNSDNIRAILTASTPAAAMVSLSQINEVAALVGTLLGIAFLLWRWRREAQKKD